jgi:hypothetical protein
MFLMKEGGSVPAAQGAAQIFQAVLQKHLIVDKSLLNKLVQLPQTTLQEKIAGLAPNFTEIVGAAKPNLAYFTDPNQNVFADLTNFLTQVGSSRMSLHPCMHAECGRQSLTVQICQRRMAMVLPASAAQTSSATMLASLAPPTRASA